MIITVDGPIATGKSTIAKALAKELGFIYFDTGAMYRCLTFGVIKHHVDIDNPQSLEEFLQHFTFDIKVKQAEKHYFVEGEDISEKIRGQEITTLVSKVSANKAVRDKLVAMQRQFSMGVNAIFEGRDMGTVVFPQAQVKVFLTGRPEVRAKRRFEELKARFPKETENLTMEETFEELNKRDLYDMSREISPLRQAPDALVVDTSDMSVHDIVFSILEYKDMIKTKRPI